MNYLDEQLQFLYTFTSTYIKFGKVRHFFTKHDIRFSFITDLGEFNNNIDCEGWCKNMKLRFLLMY